MAGKRKEQVGLLTSGPIGDRMVYKLLCCVPLLLLSSCTSTTNTALTPAQINNLLSQNLVLLPDNKFENLPPSLKENEIIFLGETHNVKPLIQASDKLSVYLASHKPVVYADEGCYGLGPFMEAASLGNPKTAMPMRLPECILEFNSNQTEDKRILMTAIDIEHSIYHSKATTVRFLLDLASRSTSDTASQAINKEIAQLTAQDTYDKMNRYLKKLKDVFLQHFDTFSSEDKDEILFSMELLAASNRYQYVNRGIIKSWQNPQEIRYCYFNKTIERAYKKAQKNKAILLCRVGSWHISMDYKCEARYFAKDYSLTKGKVATILLVPLDYDASEINDAVTEKYNDIDSVVKTLMKDNEYSYLSLSDLQKNTNNSFNWSKYYSNSGPKYDGLLFVKIDK
jgi:hypothetical protein